MAAEPCHTNRVQIHCICEPDRGMRNNPTLRLCEGPTLASAEDAWKTARTELRHGDLTLGAIRDASICVTSVTQHG